MLILTEEELVDRFKRGNVRNRPHHYILDQLGARIIAAHRGITFRELRWSREDAQALPWRADLQHQLDNNEFFVRLISACRQDGSHHLTQWWGERHCVRDWDEAVQPDGFARLDGPYGAIEFFFELDRGTESPSRLQAKLVRYEDIARLDGCPQAILFSFPDPEREVAARKRLHNPGITLATTVFDIANADPLGAVWLPIGSQRRVRLLEVPRLPKPDKHT